MLLAHDNTNPRYLYQIASSGTPSERNALADAMTGLLQTDLKQSERDIAQDILLHLLEDADNELRMSLASKLAHEPKCPQVLLDYLIFQTPLKICEPVLRYSEVLNDEYLIAVARHFRQSEYWQILAQRRKVSSYLADFLVSTDDIRVCTKLLANPGAQISINSMDTLLNMAPNVPEIHKPLLSRPEMKPELAQRLMKYVSVELQAEITTRFNVDKNIVSTALDEIIIERNTGLYKVQTITPDMLDLCFKMKQMNRITPRQLMESAKESNTELFACMLAALLNLNPEMVLQKLVAQVEITLPVLCHAARMTRGDYSQLFLMWRQKNQKSITNGAELSQAMKVFDALKFEKAQLLVQQWQKEGGTMPTQH